MRIISTRWTVAHGWTPPFDGVDPEVGLVLVFGARELLASPDAGAPLAHLGRTFPRAAITGCSTAGEIAGTEICDDTLTVTALAFERTLVRLSEVDATQAGDSFLAGQMLAQGLEGRDLRHVLVLSYGMSVNGSQMVRGIVSGLPAPVTVTGGMAGDGRRFQQTLVLHQGLPRPDCVAAVGFYGQAVRIGCGCLGGWAPFGPERLITSAKGNVLFELDGASALDLYKRYLGRHAQGLPATGMYFPLSVRARGSDQRIVRTLLSVNENDQSITFAGDVPQGAYAQLARAGNDRLVDGAMEAARAGAGPGPDRPDLAVLVSCVGRRMILGQMAEEELEAMRGVFGPDTVMTGFYSYGEIAPFTPSGCCELHNQTMTVTTISEA